MKLLLFTFVFCFAAVLAAPADKQKRDILPGDPRYGTEHHHHQEHQNHEHENEVQISKAAGGYVGSYTVPDDTEDRSFQVQPQSSYGLPNHTPGKLLGDDFFGTSDADKIRSSVLVPSTSYGIPDTTQLLNNNYLEPVIDDKKSTVIKTTVQEEPKLDIVQKTAIPEVHHVQQPAVVHEHVENTQIVSLPQAKVTTSHVPESQGVIQQSIPSYASYPSYSNIPVKTVDHHVRVQVPQPYHVPVTKHVAVPIAIPHTVEIAKPYYVRVPQPYQVTVDRPYTVEVPRPVPYPVHHYIKTSVPIAQHHLTVDTSKGFPLQDFFANTQSTFQNVLSGLPFSNIYENIQKPFENFFDYSPQPAVVSSFLSPGSSIPTEPAINYVNVPSSIKSDSVTIDNPVLKPETTVIKPAIRPITTHHIKTNTQVYKPSTACAGCTVTSAASSKQEYVQPIDANGGYVY